MDVQDISSNDAVSINPVLTADSVTDDDPSSDNDVLATHVAEAAAAHDTDAPERIWAALKYRLHQAQPTGHNGQNTS